MFFEKLRKIEKTLKRFIERIWNTKDYLLLIIVSGHQILRKTDICIISRDIKGREHKIKDIIVWYTKGLSRS